jgi:octaprenyl-diphosphate synthase
MTPLTPFPVARAGDSVRRDIAAVTKDIRPDLDRVEEQLEAWSRSANPLTAEVSRYVLRKRGKRLRPALVLLTSRLFAPAAKEAVFMASLVELIHTASLIHDDIIDRAETRRGVESVHRRWGPNITVLLGDYLYIKSIGLSLQSRYDWIIRLLAEVSAEMIEGELDEYAVGGDLGVSEELYLGIIGKKTASLFAACCRIGAGLGGATDSEESALAEFGRNLGLCFQVIDDLLDFTGDESVLGKPILSDLAEGRVTLPLIQILKTDGRPHREGIAGLIGRKEISAEDRERLLGLLSETGALAYTEAKAGEYARRALDLLGAFPDSSPRRLLAELTRFVLSRKR